MAKKKKRIYGTPDLMVNAWILAQKKGSFAAAGKILGCSGNTASKWVKAVEKDPELLEKAKRAYGGSGEIHEVDWTPGVTPKPKPSSSKLVEENAYLRWCLDGERKGYVTRLLEELGQ